ATSRRSRGTPAQHRAGPRGSRGRGRLGVCCRAGLNWSGAVPRGGPPGCAPSLPISHSATTGRVRHVRLCCLTLVVLLLALPAASLADGGGNGNSAGDNQYVDPLAGS